MSDVATAARQLRFEQKAFWRNPASAVFTFAFPLLFLVIFATINSGETIRERDNVSYVSFFVPGIIAFGLMSACYTNLAIRMTVSRDFGVLKRVRGTPIPSWVYLAGQFGSSIVITVVLVTSTTLLGVVAYDVALRAETIPAILAALALGAVCFCALGLAVSGLCPNSDAAPAVVNFSIFPLLFISGIFFPLDTAPQWLKSLAEIFPVQHLANALQVAFDPRTRGAGFSGDDLLVLGGWTVAAIGLALKYFRWESSRT